MQPLLPLLAAARRRLTFRLRESRRLRRGLRELEQMGPHELRDIGFSHPALARAAAAGACGRWI